MNEIVMAPGSRRRMLPKEIDELFAEMEDERKSGCIIVHFEQGNMRKGELHRVVRVDSSKVEAVN